MWDSEGQTVERRPAIRLLIGVVFIGLVVAIFGVEREPNPALDSVDAGKTAADAEPEGDGRRAEGTDEAQPADDPAPDGSNLRSRAVGRLFPTIAEPTAAPLSRPTKRRLVINGVGDVNVDPAYIPAFNERGYEHALSGLDGLFLDDDLTVINLECPASELGTRVPKQFNFRCDVAALPILRQLGVDVASQANNHSLDYGPDALLDSMANLLTAGIAPVGGGVDVAEANRAAVFRRRGWTVAVVGFGGVIPSPNWLATEDRPGMSDGDTVASMVAAVEAADRLADVVVVTIHWGKELQTGPPPDDVVRAEAMIDAGADAVFGHHPHRLNELGWYRDRPIFWSLGNFVWPRLSAAGSDSAVAQVIVHPDGTVDACLLDVTIVSHGHPELDDPSIRSCQDIV